MPSAIRTAEYDAFLQRLRAARKRARLTQWDVALRLNKPQSYVSKCESGERRLDVIEVIAFADLYGLSIEELVRGPLPEALASCPASSRDRLAESFRGGML